MSRHDEQFGHSPSTVRDVARLAGVSAITVSRTINNPERVSPDTLKKVRAAIRQVGYVPNLMAGGLRLSKSRLAAAVVPTIAGPVFLETIQSLTDAFGQAGYQLILGQSGYEGSHVSELIDAIIGRRPAGIVFTGMIRHQDIKNRLRNSGIPVVETWDLCQDPVDMMVGFSHVEIGEAVCRYLHRKGYRRPILISGDDDRAINRCRGFSGTARSLEMNWALPLAQNELLGDPPNDLTVPFLSVHSPATLASGRSALDRLYREREGFDSVFCSSDMLAIGVSIEAAARGLRVPDDLAIVGMGDTEYTANMSPPLTTVKINGQGIARIATDFILERTEGKSVEPHIVDVGFSIVERASA